MVSEGRGSTKGADENELSGLRAMCLAGLVWADPPVKRTLQSVWKRRRESSFLTPLSPAVVGVGRGLNMRAPWVLLGSGESCILCRGKELRGRGNCYADGGA